MRKLSRAVESTPEQRAELAALLARARVPTEFVVTMEGPPPPGAAAAE